MWCYRKEITQQQGSSPKPRGKDHYLYGRMGKDSLAGCGADHPSWNPGLTDEDRTINRAYPEYASWRTAVYEQDNYTCQKCGDATGGNLIAHHKMSYADNPELRTKVSNGITLCEPCHLNFHHQFSYGNNNKKQLEDFLNKDCRK